MSNFMQRSAIEKLVRSSKERSLVKHRLAQRSKSPILRLQSNEVGERNAQFLHQIGGAVTEVDKAALLPNRSRYCLLIADSDGIVIESYAPEGLETEFQRSGLVKGGMWDERVAGTNGISLAMQSKRVVTVRGDDHFYNCFSDFACSTAPLTDAENNLIGTITLVGAANRRPEEIALCEQALRRASKQFQTRLFRNFHSEKMTARVLLHEPASARRFETLIACDEDGVVVSHLPLWRDGARPAALNNLVGQHLSDLHQCDVSLRGPAAVLPKRRVTTHSVPHIPARIDKEGRLGRLMAEGGGLPVLAQRARKLVAHRVPMLICGEPGVETDDFARGLLEDQKLNSPMSLSFDAARPGSDADLAEALNSLQFLSDYPVNKVTPTLILRNVDSLNPQAQLDLERFLDTDEDASCDRNLVQKPVLLFTAGKPWKAMQSDATIPRNLLYLVGQSVLELPPVRQRDREAVLDNVMAHDIEGSKEVTNAAKDVLIHYDWPGNIREMRAVLREALICGNGKRINVVDLPERLSNPCDNGEKSITRVSLRDALDSTNWNVTKAAHLLGKSRATLNRWIASEGLQRPE